MKGSSFQYPNKTLPEQLKSLAFEEVLGRAEKQHTLSFCLVVKTYIFLGKTWQKHI